MPARRSWTMHTRWAPCFFFFKRLSTSSPWSATWSVIRLRQPGQHPATTSAAAAAAGICCMGPARGGPCKPTARQAPLMHAICAQRPKYLSMRLSASQCLPPRHPTCGTCAQRPSIWASSCRLGRWTSSQWPRRYTGAHAVVLQAVTVRIHRLEGSLAHLWAIGAGAWKGARRIPPMVDQRGGLHRLPGQLSSPFPHTALAAGWTTSHFTSSAAKSSSPRGW